MYNSMWFNNLEKPLFNPPSEIFPPIWAFLYITIILSFLIFAATKSNYNKGKGFIFFTIQMILNFIWSPVFFSFQNINLALCIIILMLIFIIFTIVQFYKVSKISGIILIPYLLWVSFATYLNIAYAVLN